MNKKNEKVCQECGEPIQGRADKIFCCDQCRNNYNNRLNSDANNYVRNINNILRKNRRILAELNPKSDKAKVHKEKLLLQGFNFNYFTHIYNTQNGNKYVFCYDQGYLQLEEAGYYLLVTNKKHE